MSTAKRRGTPLAQVAAAMSLGLILMWLAATFLGLSLIYLEGVSEPWHLTVGAIAWLIYTGASAFGSVVLWAVADAATHRP